MSVHEPEPPKEERPGFTGARLEELRPGMVVYRHGIPEFPYFPHRLCHFVYTETYEDEEGASFSLVPIGRHGYENRLARSWYAPTVALEIYYSRTPTPEYVVLRGLEVPDELLYEVYQYVD